MAAPIDEKESVELKVTDGESPEIVATPEEPEAAPETPKTVDCTPPETGLPNFGDGIETIAFIVRDGYGELYKVHNAQLNKDMCARLIPASKFHNEESRKSFLRFCRRYITITHPSMVPLYSFREDENGIWFLMDSIEGPSLENWMDSGEFKSSAKIADIFAQLIECIKALHKVGIRFGAMHPAGVFIVDNGHGHTIQLRDWWAYALLQAQEGQPHPDSLPYSSPEQLQGDGKLDERADVYTFGAMLFEALTGSTPFTHPDSLKLAIKIMKDAAPKVDGQYAGTPFAQIAERCLCKDQTERYQTFEELEEDLNAAARGAPLKSRDNSQTSSIGSTRRIGIMMLISFAVLAWFTSFYMRELGNLNGLSVEPPPMNQPLTPTTDELDQRAYDYEDDGKYDLALAYWIERAQQAPNDAKVLTNKARLEALTHDHDTSILDYSRAQTLDPTNGDPSYQLGQLYNTLGQPQAALTALKKALATAPQDGEYLNEQSFAYTLAGNFKEAINSAKQAVAIDPNNYEFHFNLGIAYYGAGDYKNALAAEDAALQLSDHDPAIWTNLSLTYLKLGMHKEAIAAATEATNLDPHDVAFAVNLGHAYASAGRLQQAEQVYRHALNLDRFDGTAWAGLADTLKKLGRTAEAEDAAKRVFE